jgi:hypothetical protein
MQHFLFLHQSDISFFGIIQNKKYNFIKIEKQYIFKNINNNIFNIIYKMSDSKNFISDLDYSKKIDEISKSIFKHIRNIDEKSVINLSIIFKDNNYIKYNIALLDNDKKIHEKCYKKKYNSKRGLNSINNLWHNKNKANKVNPVCNNININNDTINCKPQNTILMKDKNYFDENNNVSLKQDPKINKFNKKDIHDSINNNTGSIKNNNMFLSPKKSDSLKDDSNINIFDENEESENNISMKDIDEKKINHNEVLPKEIKSNVNSILTSCKSLSNIINIESINEEVNLNAYNQTPIDIVPENNICKLTEHKMLTYDIKPNIKLNNVNIPQEKLININSVNVDSLKNIKIDEKILIKIKNINDNIGRIPGCFAELYYLCKDYKEGNKWHGNFNKKFDKIQKKVAIINEIIKSECKYILDLYS